MKTENKHNVSALKHYCETSCVSGLVGLGRLVDKSHLQPMAVSMMLLSASNKLVGLLEKSPFLKTFIHKRDRDVLHFESFLFVHGLILSSILSEPTVWERTGNEEDSFMETLLGSKVIGIMSIERLCDFEVDQLLVKNRTYLDDVSENMRIYSYALFGCKGHDRPPFHVLPQTIPQESLMAILGVCQVFISKILLDTREQIVNFMRRHSGDNSAKLVTFK